VGEERSQLLDKESLERGGSGKEPWITEVRLEEECVGSGSDEVGYGAHRAQDVIVADIFSPFAARKEKR